MQLPCLKIQNFGSWTWIKDAYFLLFNIYLHLSLRTLQISPHPLTCTSPCIWSCSKLSVSPRGRPWSALSREVTICSHLAAWINIQLDPYSFFPFWNISLMKKTLCIILRVENKPPWIFVFCFKRTKSTYLVSVLNLRTLNEMTHHKAKSLSFYSHGSTVKPQFLLFELPQPRKTIAVFIT